MLTPNKDNPFLASMARTLWVLAYADCVEEEEHTWSQDPLIASIGEDWMNVAPETPQEAFDMAFMLLGHFEAANKTSWPCIVAKAFEPEGLNINDSKLLDSFGHYAVMSCLGHGVSWEDDHEDVGIVYPDTESSELESVVINHLSKEGIRLLESKAS